jgi:hypothetical protein
MYLTAITALAVFGVGELFFNLIGINGIKRYFLPDQRKPFFCFDLSILKGMLERLVLFIGLHYEFAAVLALFGTLKIGTRLDSQKNEISNDYFLVGNLTTVCAAFLYTVVFSKLIL